MGYSKEKKRRKKKEDNKRVRDVLKSFWVQKRPVIYFVSGFIFLMALFYLLWLSPFYSKFLHPTIVSTNAILSGILLNLLGQETTTHGDVIYSSAFSISVKKGCDAIEAMALFITAVLAFPIKWNHKFRGLITGIILIFILNLVRIVSLFLTGVYYPEAFDTMHIEVWQVLFIIFSLILWIYVIKQDRKPKPDA
jgi:exosortase H (IPTLxxWG-CTERM-specific)